MTNPQRRQVVQAAAFASGPIIPSPHGTHDAKEAWMRQRQRERVAQIEGEREAQLIAEADAAMQRRAIRRCQQELELRSRLLAEAELIVAKRGKLRP